MGIITLLTDFGTKDEYVGVLKGVIYGINPAVTLVDLSHEVAPQDVAAAAYLIKTAHAYFPQGTVHVVVVDPGVGSRRNILAADISGHLFLAPDNGVLGPVLTQGEVASVVVLDAPHLYRRPVSRTFHGRDIFAPVAAHLSLGYALTELGKPLNPALAVGLAVDEPRRSASGELCGSVVRMDRFGNLITNISLQHLAQAGYAQHSSSVVVRIGDLSIEGISTSYANGHAGTALALIGSSNCLEIAVSMGNAAEALGIRHGAVVSLSRR